MYHFPSFNVYSLTITQLKNPFQKCFQLDFSRGDTNKIYASKHASKFAAYARAQSSEVTPEVKSNAEIPEEGNLEDLDASDIIKSSSPTQETEVNDANADNTEKESNINGNNEELDVAPTNLAPSVAIPFTNDFNNNENLDVAPTNFAPIVVLPTSDTDESNYADDLDVAPTNSVPSVERQGRYKALPDQYDEGTAPRSAGKLICKEKNERYSVPGSCDKYVECLVNINHLLVAINKLIKFGIIARN